MVIEECSILGRSEVLLTKWMKVVVCADVPFWRNCTSSCTIYSGDIKRNLWHVVPAINPVIVVSLPSLGSKPDGLLTTILHCSIYPTDKINGWQLQLPRVFLGCSPSFWSFLAIWLATNSLSCVCMCTHMYIYICTHTHTLAQTGLIELGCGVCWACKRHQSSY